MCFLMTCSSGGLESSFIAFLSSLVHFIDFRMLLFHAEGEKPAKVARVELVSSLTDGSLFMGSNLSPAIQPPFAAIPHALVLWKLIWQKLVGCVAVMVM
jgi:hypothetical protein